MKYEFKFSLNRNDVVSLRKEAFLAKYDKDQINLSGLDWNWTDDHSNHLGLYQDNRLVSCLRLSVFNSSSDFYNASRIPMKMDCSSPYTLLARAATHPDYASQGLHNLLRLRALEICQHMKLDNIFGSLAENSDRLKQLSDLGYEIVGTAESWENSYLKNTGKVVLIHLKQEKLSHAIQLLLQKCKVDRLSDFPETIKRI
jgi:predicted GNAT family N-acyltransferase